MDPAVPCIDCSGPIPVATASLIVAAIFGFQLRDWRNGVPLAVAIWIAALAVTTLGRAATGLEFDLPPIAYNWTSIGWFALFTLVLAATLATHALTLLFRSGERRKAVALIAGGVVLVLGTAFATEYAARNRFVYQSTEPDSKLAQATRKLDVAHVRKLVAADEVQSKEDLDRALAFAVLAGDERLIRDVVKRGGDINARSNLGTAAARGEPSIVSLLLSLGADAHRRGLTDGRSALHDATGNMAFPFPIGPVNVDRRAVIEILVKAGIPVDIRDYAHHTPLIWNRTGDPIVVSTLVAFGADVNAQDTSGATALMTNDDPKATELLLAAGANPFLKDLNGRTVRESHDDSDGLRQRAAIISAVDRWIEANPTAAQSARNEATRLGVSRVPTREEVPMLYYQAPKVEDIMEPAYFTLFKLAVVVLFELILVGLMRIATVWSMRRLGFQV